MNIRMTIATTRGYLSTVLTSTPPFRLLCTLPLIRSVGDIYLRSFWC